MFLSFPYVVRFKNKFHIDILYISLRGLTAMTLACRAGNPGSTPGVGVRITYRFLGV